MRNMVDQVDNALFIPKPSYTRKNLDKQVLTTTKWGLITPNFVMETVPGGEYDLTPETLVRLQPLSSPLMHKAQVKTMYFHVPYRIMWRNWEYFIQGKPDPLTGLVCEHPYYTADYLASGGVGTNGVGQRIPDYFGMKAPSTAAGSVANIRLNPFPLVAYQYIWNRWFRHQAVVPESKRLLYDGLQSFSDYTWSITPRIACYNDDYFNSVLPQPQKGAASQIDDEARVFTNHGSNDVPVGGAYNLANTVGGYQYKTYEVKAREADVEANELFSRVQIDVEELRRASAIQKYLEIANNVGNYVDFMKAYYDVTIPDERLQNPALLGGSSSNIVISDVMNTADTNQGRITGNGATYSQGGGCSYKALEHGLIIGVTVVTYDSTHIDAKNKVHFKLNRTDYYNPTLDNLGEQAITVGQINRLDANAATVFGYLPQNYDYRASFHEVSGEMATSYRHWHLARDYAPLFGVTGDFYTVLDDRRVFQVQDAAYDPILLQHYHNVKAYLPMASLPIPTM